MLVRPMVIRTVIALFVLGIASVGQATPKNGSPARFVERYKKRFEGPFSVDAGVVNSVKRFVVGANRRGYRIQKTKFGYKTVSPSGKVVRELTYLAFVGHAKEIRKPNVKTVIIPRDNGAAFAVEFLAQKARVLDGVSISKGDLVHVSTVLKKGGDGQKILRERVVQVINR